MEYKIGLRLILFFAICIFGELPVYKLQDLKEEKMGKFIEKKNYSHQNTL